MYTLIIKCEKHPEQTITLQTGLSRQEYAALDEKGRAELDWKDKGAQESFIQKTVDHFTKCDGQMIRVAVQNAD